jgi:hypothetical protein
VKERVQIKAMKHGVSMRGPTAGSLDGPPHENLEACEVFRLLNFLCSPKPAMIVFEIVSPREGWLSSVFLSWV